MTYPVPAYPVRRRISVVIPHLNQPDLLDLCLSRITPQTSGEGWELAEILVCDNGSSPDCPAAAICAAHPPARLIDAADIPGPGHARNRGVAEAQGALIAFTDSDTIPAPDWLARIAAAFDADPGLEVLGGDIRISRADPARITPVEAYESVFSFRARDYVERDHYAATANMAALKAVFDRVGPFGGIEIAEDIDWGRRATAAGVRICYVPQVLVQHPARADFPELARKWDRLTAHAWAEARGTKGRAKWLLKALALALSGPAGLPRILRSDRIDGARARWDAFRVLWGIRFYRARLMLRLAVNGSADGLSGAAWRGK
jgi:GT2 family glycosyltransferase